MRTAPVSSWLPISFLIACSLTVAQTATADQNNLTEPFYFQESNQLSVSGTVNYGAADDLLKGYGLRPLPVGDSQHAIMTISIVSYGKSSFGPYREFVVMIPAQQATDTLTFKSVRDYLIFPPKEDPSIKSPRVSNFMLLLILDGEDRQAVQLGHDIGRQLYGYPKEFGSVVIKTLEDGSTNYSVKSLTEELKVSTVLGSSLLDRLLNRLKIPFSSIAYAYTTGNGHLQIEKMELSGKVGLPRSIDRRQFSLETSGKCKALFENLNFTPKNRVSVSNMKMKLTGVQ